MAFIGWILLLILLLASRQLGGIALGLLSGLALSLLTFCNYVQPVSPPYELIILQASWLIFVSTLEAVGFFNLLENKCKHGLTHSRSLLWVILLCTGLTFSTGNKASCYAWIKKNPMITRHKKLFLILIRTISHMMLLISPLSITGLLLYVTINSHMLSILPFIGTVLCLTVGLIGITWMIYLIPIRRPTDHQTKQENDQNTPAIDPMEAKPGKTKRYLLLGLLLLGSTILFSLTQSSTGHTYTLLGNRIFPIKLPLFFVLVLLSVSAIALLSFSLKPAKIIQTHRFKVGINQFCIFLGLCWLLETLIAKDHKLILLSLISYRIAPCICWLYCIAFYLILSSYLLLIGTPMVIWLFIPLLLLYCRTALEPTIWLLVIHSLSPLLDKEEGHL